MRVLQLIDSLRPGGAEKMAVNIANALVPHVEGSYLCCTRQEGMLKDQIKPRVEYLFLDKKSSLDPKAIFRLRKYIQKHRIDIIHAHSTSYFIAGILKLSGGRFKLIWQDHYGESEFLGKRNFKVLKKFSRFFAGIISVNTCLKIWATENLHCKNVIEIKNFISEPNPAVKTKIQLKGNKNDFKIICVANLRPQKDHLNLIKAIESISQNYSLSLHLIGAKFEDLYSESVLSAIRSSPSCYRIFYYGEQAEIFGLLAQANLGILASKSEGLPVALLEYGMVGLPVVSTRVGQCEKLIGKFGKLVSPNDPEGLAEAIIFYLNNPEKREKDSLEFKQTIVKNYTEKSVLRNISEFYKTI